MNTENNKIIAEFMELVESSIPGNYYTHKSKEGFGCGQLVDKLPYDTDWNWLMEVVHKCLEICHNEMFNEWENSFADKFLACDIKVIYKESLEFIKWYNNLKN
jgi:hypothetical protein